MATKKETAVNWDGNNGGAKETASQANAWEIRDNGTPLWLMDDNLAL